MESDAVDDVKADVDDDVVDEAVVDVVDGEVVDGEFVDLDADVVTIVDTCDVSMFFFPVDAWLFKLTVDNGKCSD